MQAIRESNARDPLSLVFADHPFEVFAASRLRMLYVPRFGTSPQAKNLARGATPSSRLLRKWRVAPGSVSLPTILPADCQSGFSWLPHQVKTASFAP
jgi:hypothetical protein